MQKLLLLGAFMLAGCLASDPITTFDGAYTLRTVNGAPLPFTLPGGTADTKVELVEEVITIHPGLTYTQVSTVRTTANGQATITIPHNSGSIAFEGYSMKMRPAAGGIERIGNLKGASFTVVDIGTVYVYSQ